VIDERQRVKSVFLSYSRQDDSLLATALRRGLEGFAKPWYRRTRSLHVFQDVAGMQASAGLWSSLEQHLRRADWFILLASPASARSAWAERETLWWLENRPVGRILIVLASGEIKWADDGGEFDPDLTTALNGVLRGRFTEQPAWVDLRWTDLSTPDRRDPRLQDAVGSLMAAVQELPKDQLIGEHLREFRRTRRVAVISGMALGSLLTTSVLAGVAAYRQSQEARRSAETALSRELSASSSRLLGSDPELAALLAVEAYRAAPTADAAIALGAAGRLNLPQNLAGHSAGVTGVALSSDGHWAATGSRDRTARVWDLPSRRLRWVLRGHSETVNQVAFSPDGQALATVSDDGTARIWDLATGRAIRTLHGLGRLQYVVWSPDNLSLAVRGDQTAFLWTPHLGFPLIIGNWNTSGLAFSPNGQELAVAGMFGVELRNVTDARKIRTLPEYASGDESDIVFSAGARTLSAFSTTGGKAAWWDLLGAKGGARVAVAAGGARAVGPGGRTLFVGESGVFAIRDVRKGHASDVRIAASSVLAARFSADGKTLATAETDAVTLWSVTTGEKIASSPVSVLARDDGRALDQIAITANGRTAVVVGADQTAYVLDAREPASEPLIVRPADPALSDADLDPTEKLLATTGEAGRVRLWDARSGRLVMTLSVSVRPVRSVRFTSDGKRLITAGDDLKVRIWDVVTGRILAIMSGHTGSALVGAGPFNNDQQVFSYGYDGTARLWDAKTGDAVVSYGGHSGVVLGLETLPEGRGILTLGTEGTIVIHDPLTGQMTSKTTVANWESIIVNSADFASDHHTLAVAEDSGDVRIWDTLTRRQTIQIQAGVKSANATLAFSPDNSLLATAGRIDGTVRLWDAHTGAARGVLRGGSSIGEHVTFSPDGTRIVMAAQNGTLYLWDVASGSRMGTLTGHTGTIDGLSFSADGRRLITHSWDGTARIWNAGLPLSHTVARICTLVPRDLTSAERSEYLSGLTHHTCG
jgi:WD40 repeat protein